MYTDYRNTDYQGLTINWSGHSKVCIDWRMDALYKHINIINYGWD